MYGVKMNYLMQSRNNQSHFGDRLILVSTIFNRLTIDFNFKCY